MAKRNPMLVRLEVLEEEKTHHQHRLEVLEEQVKRLLADAVNLHTKAQLKDCDEFNTMRLQLIVEKNVREYLEEELKKKDEILKEKEEFAQRLEEQYQEIVKMFRTVHMDKEKYLISTAKIGNTSGVKFLMDVGANPDTTDDKGKTPLHIAAEAGHFEVVQMLLDSGGHVNAMDINKRTPLYLAAVCDHTQICKALINAKTSVNQGCGMELLHWTAYHGNLDVCHSLISAGAHINAVASDKRTALHFAAEKNYIEICQLLIDSKCDINQCDANSETPLHFAAREGNLSAVKLLVKHNADTTIKDKDGNTALDRAVQKRKTDIVTFLKNIPQNE